MATHNPNAPSGITAVTDEVATVFKEAGYGDSDIARVTAEITAIVPEDARDNIVFTPFGIQSTAQLLLALNDPSEGKNNASDPVFRKLLNDNFSNARARGKVIRQIPELNAQIQRGLDALLEHYQTRTPDPVVLEASPAVPVISEPIPPALQAGPDIRGMGQETPRESVPPAESHRPEEPASVASSPQAEPEPAKNAQTKNAQTGLAFAAVSGVAMAIAGIWSGLRGKKSQEHDPDAPPEKRSWVARIAPWAVATAGAALTVGAATHYLRKPGGPDTTRR